MVWIRACLVAALLGGLAPHLAAAPFSEGDAAALRQKLQGRWVLYIPNMREQKLDIQGDRAVYTILPEGGRTGQKADVFKGTLDVVGPNHVRVKAADEHDFALWIDKEGQLHLHNMMFFKPLTIAGRQRFTIEDDTSSKLAYDGGKCRFSNYEITTPRPVACGFGEEGTFENVIMFGGTTEFFYYAIPGKEKEEDPYFRYEIYYVDGNLLVPATLAMTTVVKDE